VRESRRRRFRLRFGSHASHLKHVVTRIYVLLARKAASALVFRRGPSKNVLLLRWDLAEDTIQEGQWLRGHIYERRCDLSPSGEHLVYFAAKWRGKYPSFTAVSRPPFLTALALWEGLWARGAVVARSRTKKRSS